MLASKGEIYAKGIKSLSLAMRVLQAGEDRSYRPGIRALSLLEVPGIYEEDHRGRAQKDTGRSDEIIREQKIGRAQTIKIIGKVIANGYMSHTRT